MTHFFRLLKMSLLGFVGLTDVFANSGSGVK